MKTLVWESLRPGGSDALGLLPTFLAGDDDRKAAVQFNDRCGAHGGWRAVANATVDPETKAMLYPGDPPCPPMARTQLRDETIYVYRWGFVGIVQADGSNEVSRLD